MAWTALEDRLLLQCLLEGLAWEDDAAGVSRSSESTTNRWCELLAAHAPREWQVLSAGRGASLRVWGRQSDGCGSNAVQARGPRGPRGWGWMSTLVTFVSMRDRPEGRFNAPPPTTPRPFSAALVALRGGAAAPCHHPQLHPR